VAGANGMVGSAIARIIGADDNATILTPTRKELDLTSFVQVEKYFTNNRITDVYLAAAKVGGIHANSVYPADFIGENLTIQSNVIGTAHKTGVEKLLFLGSSCIYPKFAEQPIREASLLTGALESTNEAYAIAKIAGLKLCEYYSKQYGVDYRSVMPCNLYGPNDNFHEKNSQMIWRVHVHM
jgi:GDP-L-fucose synthase